MKIIKAIWVDAETVGDCNWQDFGEIKEMAKRNPPIMQTVGFVLYESESHISVVDSIGEEDCGHLTKIPKSMIKEMVELV
tara:strand:+ start:258 stop:497 length:240 start_codon:yes stop_codon:yes gene_type:complete